MLPIYIIYYNRYDSWELIGCTADKDKAEKIIADSDDPSTLGIEQLFLEKVPELVKEYWEIAIFKDEIEKLENNIDKGELHPLKERERDGVIFNENVIQFGEDEDGYYGITLVLRAKNCSFEEAKEIAKKAFKIYLEKYPDKKPAKVSLSDLIPSNLENCNDEFFNKLIEYFDKNTYGKAIRELDSYLQFKEGWDGYRGKEFSPYLIQSAKEVVVRAEAFYGDTSVELTPGPGSDGRVDIEIDYKDKILFINLEKNKDDFINIHIELVKEIRDKEGISVAKCSEAVVNDIAVRDIDLTSYFKMVHDG
ncbi:MAG: hypothetical protein WC783_00510 [Candidatus Paceibacterota bacterium]|jgi:hypothetical protein